MRAKKIATMGLVGLFTVLAVATTAAAQDATADHESSGLSIGAGLLAIGAGLAVGLAGLGTGIAEKDIGAAAVGATAEKPEMFGRGLVLMVIPETIVLFGFVIAFLLMNNIAA